MMKGRAVGDFLRLCLLPMAMDALRLLGAARYIWNRTTFRISPFFQHSHTLEGTSHFGVAKHTQD